MFSARGIDWPRIQRWAAAVVTADPPYCGTKRASSAALSGICAFRSASRNRSPNWACSLFMGATVGRGLPHQSIIDLCFDYLSLDEPAASVPKSLLEELPVIVREGRQQAERILESLETRHRVRLQTREWVLPSRDVVAADWVALAQRAARLGEGSRS